MQFVDDGPPGAAMRQRPAVVTSRVSAAKPAASSPARKAAPVGEILLVNRLVYQSLRSVQRGSMP
jgi:hypothetical protein